MTETVLWGWEQQDDGGGVAHGIFESKEEAIEDALGYLKPGEKRDITVGHVKELEAADYVTVDSDEILDQAAQECWDLFNFDRDRPFDFVSTEIIPEAVQELHKFMREWAGKYLYNVDGFWVLEDTEEVTISKEALEDDDAEIDDEDDDGDGDGDGGDDNDDSEDDEDSDEEDEGEDEDEKEDESKEKGPLTPSC